MIDDGFFDDVAAAVERLRGWGEHADARFRGLDRATEMPLLAAAMTIAAAARITAALEKLEASVRALQPQRDDIADDERVA